MLVAEINEKITVRYRGTFNDLDGAPIQLADMTTLNLTMFLTRQVIERSSYRISQR